MHKSLEINKIADDKRVIVSSAANESGITDHAVRLHHLDWLRVLIVFNLIPYHTAGMFLGIPWLINNNESSQFADAFVQILDQFQMPLLFTVAGAAVWFSLGVRSKEQYLIERLRRLVIPIIFGMLVLNAPVFFASILNHNKGELYNNSFFNWYQTYLKTMLFPWQRAWSPGGLWFIWYLSIYSIGLMPILIILRKHAHSNLWSKFGKLFEKRGMMFLLAITPVLAQIYPLSNNYMEQIYPLSDNYSGFPMLYFVFFFLYGFFIYSSPKIQQSIDKIGPFALVVSAVSITLVMLLIFPNPKSAPLGSIYWATLGSGQRTLGNAIYLLLGSISRWFSIIGIMFLARRYLDYKNRFLRYASEAVLPFYLMHATFIVVIGYYVVPLNIGIIYKFIIVAISSFIATLIAFEISKRFNITRLLLGMRTKKKGTNKFSHDISNIQQYKP